MSERKRKPYIVCCGVNGRCVVYGWSSTEPASGKPKVLYDARMVLYWDSECKGLFGLAASGPKGKTRITHSIHKTETSPVTEWLSVSIEAAKKFDEWK